MGNDIPMGFIYGLVGLVIIILVFLVCREIVCWYFKINATLHELRMMKEDLALQHKTLAYANGHLSEAVKNLQIIANYAANPR